MKFLKFQQKLNAKPIQATNSPEVLTLY